MKNKTGCKLNGIVCLIGAGIISMTTILCWRDFPLIIQIIYTGIPIVMVIIGILQLIWSKRYGKNS